MTVEDKKDFSKPPFEVYLCAEDNTVTFDNYEAVSEWAEKQLELWQSANVLRSVLGQASEQAWQHLIRPFNQLRNSANVAISNTDENSRQGARSSISQHLELLENGTIATADSPVGTRIIEDIDRSPNDAAARMVWIVGHELTGGVTMSPAMWMNIIKVGIEEQAGTVDARVHKSRLTKLYNEWNKSFSETQKACKETFSEFEDETRKRLRQGIRLGGQAIRRIVSADRAYAATVRDHTAELDRIRKAFIGEMRLRGPARYWLWRMIVQWGSAVLGFAAFAGISIGSVYGLWTNWETIFSFSTDASVPNAAVPGVKGFNLIPIAMLTLPVILLLWLLRLVSRFYVGALASARDAGHRRMLIKTYLALMAEPDAGMQDTDRLLVLQALFRPENPNNDDDAPPPNLLEIINRTVNPQR